MKKIFFISFCLFIIIFNINCGYDPQKVNGECIKLKDGRIIEIQWFMGEYYRIFPIDTSKFQLK
jgi:hypothetical protein